MQATRRQCAKCWKRLVKRGDIRLDTMLILALRDDSLPAVLDYLQ